MFSRFIDSGWMPFAAEKLVVTVQHLVPGSFPLSVEGYEDQALTLLAKLSHRIAVDAFNLVGAVIFIAAILHTFLAAKFIKLSHKIQQAHDRKTAGKGRETCMLARFMHYCGEVEIIFGLWAVVLFFAIAIGRGWSTATNYFSGVNFTEAIFVVVIMIMAASKPIMALMESLVLRIAGLMGGSPAVFWWIIMTLNPLMGSIITEPAAMTISAMLLAQRFYGLRPSLPLRYATLGLLFVNVSIGGTFTNFAAPPVLMVAGVWGWSSTFMAMTFGIKALLAMLISNTLCYLMFLREFRRLSVVARSSAKMMPTGRDGAVSTSHQMPLGIHLVHIFFMIWTVVNAHHPVLIIGGLLFFIGFTQISQPYQDRLRFRESILVGFFLAGLLIHGGMQGWWISPVLSSFGELPLYLLSTALTSFNDNAAITYLSTLVKGGSDTLRYVVVAGAMAGGGLTVIANAPNPAGQAILAPHFPQKIIAPLWLLVAALPPTTVVMLVYWLWR